MAQQEQGSYHPAQPVGVADQLSPPPEPSAPRTYFSPRAVLELFGLRRLPLTLLVLLLAGVFVRLGFWQLDRLAQREARNGLVRTRLMAPPLQLTGNEVDPQALAFRHAVVTGTFDYDHEVLLSNRTRGGKPGYHLLTPLRLQGSDTAVIVDRGWIPLEQSSPDARRVFRGAATAEVSGLILQSQSTPKGVTFGQRSDSWFWADIAHIQQQTPYRLLPFYVEQSPAPGAPDLPWRSETELALDNGPHLSYAIQWFTFAVIAIVGYVGLSARRPVKPDGAQIQDEVV